MATSLKSFLENRWQEGRGKPSDLYNPSTEEVVAQTSTEGLDFQAAVRFARERGGPALRALTFPQRAELCARLAQVINDAREELIADGITNAGNTRSDAKFDVDGAAATLMAYAELGRKLPAARALIDGEGLPIGRSARLYGQHALVPRQGVAVQINAFNFPAWGMAEKLAVSLLAGVPVITKPATATALLAYRLMDRWVSAGILPEGALSFVCGGVGDLLVSLGGQDVLAFTGSGHTAETLRRSENLARENVHFNVEADSLNAAILGPDVELSSETFNLFLNDVVKEITQKAGQKCTAVRRIFAPKGRVAEIRAALVERLADVRIGNPADEKTTMGPLSTRSQLSDVRAGIEKLAARAEIAIGGTKQVDGIGAPAGKGYFIAPTLLVQEDARVDDPVNRLEVFGPVATLVGYENASGLIQAVASGGGGLVSALYSDDRAFLEQTFFGIAAYHGRVVISGQKVAGQTVPPGMVLPSLVHGGPGRAGGGEELGGMRGLGLYLQRVAIQGHRGMIEQMLGMKPGS